MTAQTGLAVSRDGSNNGTTPKGFRLAVGGLLAGNGGSATDVRKGVLWDGGASVVTGAAGMSYNVRACRVVVMPSATQGPIIVSNDASVSVATTAAPGSNSRIDSIWVRQHLVAADGGADSDVVAEFGVTQGTAAAVPAAPSIPSGAVELARAVVTSGATATNTLTFSQTHLWTVANGAPVPVRNNTERTALTFDGSLVHHLGDDQLQRYDGSSWVNLSGKETQSGTGVMATNSAGTGRTSETVVFPVPFSVAPKVSVTALTSSPELLSTTASAASTTQVTVWMHRTTGSGSVSFDWIAVAP